jgi:hypothetical protein
MAGSQPGGIISWERSPKDDESPPSKRQAPYGRSIGWAIVAWLVALAVLFLIGQVPSLSDLFVLASWAGLIIGGWFGGAHGGIRGRREWIIFVLLLIAILFLAIGVGGCVLSIALYG